MTHNPLRAATLLRDIFANERTRVGFFLGAGCPVSIRIVDDEGKNQPLIPDVAGLTAAIRIALAGEKPALLEKIDNVLKAAGAATANIEEILSTVRSLADVVGTGTVHGLSREELQEVETYICAHIGAVTSVGLTEGKKWIQSARAMDWGAGAASSGRDIYDKLRPLDRRSS